jgi:GT2 family glycosyltransferase
MNSAQTNANRWIQEGDALRDSGRPEKAAAAYRRAIELQPSLPSIHVQLGNMLKDAGRYGEAEHAYRDALRLGADAADTHLQLGRALRLDGRRDAALQAFTASLKANPSSQDAVRELIALGESWTAQQHTRLGALSIAEAVASLDEVRRIMARVERLLPEVASLASIPPSRWDLWRRLWRVPPAPHLHIKFGLLVNAEGAPLREVLNCVVSLRDQSYGPLVATMVTADPVVKNALAQQAILRPQRFCLAPCDADTQVTSRLRAALETPELTDTSWIGVAIEPLVFDREAVGWLAAAMAGGEHVVTFCDEDRISECWDRSSAEPFIHANPWLKGAADPELLEAGHPLGSLIVARRDSLLQGLTALDSEILALKEDPTLWWPALHRILAAQGPVAHVQKVLVSRQTADSPAVETTTDRRAIARSNVQPPQGKPVVLHILIPTRDRLDVLSPCIAALLATAEVPSAITITVIDNGSRDLETAAYLAEGRKQGWFDVLALDEPFNWSRLNNAAAAHSGSPILVFVNNDIEMTASGWDTRLRDLLSCPEIGAVGARLLYPDGTVQHAGIVLGIGAGGSEHEGRGASAEEGGPNGRWHKRRSVSAVTGALLACRRRDFEAVGGFDVDGLGIWFNDVDLCLKLIKRGLRVVYEPAIEAVHHESRTLAAEFNDQLRAALFEAAAALVRQRWGAAFEHDPFFNTHYARWGTPFAWLRPPVAQ